MFFNYVFSFTFAANLSYTFDSSPAGVTFDSVTLSVKLTVEDSYCCIMGGKSHMTSLYVVIIDPIVSRAFFLDIGKQDIVTSSFLPFFSNVPMYYICDRKCFSCFPNDMPNLADISTPS